MCGIFGIVPAHDGEIDSAKLQASAQSLDHRGPDSRAVFAAPGVGLAHTRLSFLDTDARADQPFWDASGRYALVYNGEIYNYRALRAQLEARGVAFRTTSDTEVVLYWLLHNDPVTALRAMEGMFAFALFDREDRSLLLARDRFGMKPLFVQDSPAGFLFASETKALRPWVVPQVDRFMVASYLLKFRGPTRGFTFLDGVTAVTPGSLIRKRPGHAAEHQLFATLEDFLSRDAIAAQDARSPAQTVDQFDALLRASVSSHLLADVPVGAFCSGGVDSSLLMAMAAREHNNLAIFHANVKGRWSEYSAAAELSKHLHLDLRAVDVEEQDFIDYLPQTMRHFEQPFADRPNCVPMMLVAQLARAHGVKGLLSGEGSDECFLGYPWLGRKKLTDAYYAAGTRLRRTVRKIPGLGDILWPVSDSNADSVRTLFNRREVADDAVHTRAALDALGNAIKSPAHEWTFDHLHHHLRVLLHRNDTMGMAGSIESRFPFLDHAVVAAAVNLPVRYKLRRDWTVLDKAHPFIRDKWVVRQVANRYMPHGLSQRPKFGFWTTVFDRTRIAPAYFDNSYAGDLLGLSCVQMRDMVAESNPAFQLRLLHLDLWGRICIAGEGDNSNVVRLRDHVRIAAE